MAVSADMADDFPRPMGRLMSTFGVRGYIKVESYTAQPEDLFDYSPWFIRRRGAQWREIQVEDWQTHGDIFIVRFSGVNVREEAALLTGMEIGIRRSSLPPVAENEFYLIDLIGCEVIGIGGVKLGKVSRMWDHGASPIMELSPSDHLASGKAEKRLIPYVAGPIVKKVDLSSKTIWVEWGEDY